MSYATAIGPRATALNEGEFAVICRGEGEQLLIRADGSAEWVDGMPLDKVAAGAAKTLVELWRDEVPDETRALVLGRLYGRLDCKARERSLAGVGVADVAETLEVFDKHAQEFLGEPSDDAVAASISLMDVFDSMSPKARHTALATLISVGLRSSSRKADNARG